MSDFEKDVQTYLGAQQIIDGQTGWPSTIGGSHDESDRLVVLNPDAGPDPEVPASEGLGSAALEWSVVHIRVRSGLDGRDEAKTKALAIRTALHGLQGTDVGDTTVMTMRALGNLAFVPDGNARPNFTLTYVATVAQVVS